jgi:hypothetical protein
MTATSGSFLRVGCDTGTSISLPFCRSFWREKNAAVENQQPHLK